MTISGTDYQALRSPPGRRDAQMRLCAFAQPHGREFAEVWRGVAVPVLDFRKVELADDPCSKRPAHSGAFYPPATGRSIGHRHIDEVNRLISPNSRLDCRHIRSGLPGKNPVRDDCARDRSRSAHQGNENRGSGQQFVIPQRSQSYRAPRSSRILAIRLAASCTATAAASRTSASSGYSAAMQVMRAAIHSNSACAPTPPASERPSRLHPFMQRIVARARFRLNRNCHEVIQ